MKKKLGFMTVDMLLALILMSSIFNLFLKLSTENNIQQEAKLVAEQMTFISDVVKNMLRGESARILAGTTSPSIGAAPGSTVGNGLRLKLTEDNVRQVLAKYLPAGMTINSLPRSNIWRGLYNVMIVRKPYFAVQNGADVPKPELDTLTAVVYTTDDPARVYAVKKTDEFLYKTNMRAAHLLGALGGYTKKGQSTLSGIGWDYAGLPDLTQGNLGVVASYNEDAGGGPFLYRIDVGDPVLNTMQTSIDMDNNDMNKVRSVHLENTTPLSTWEKDCKNNTLTHKDGRVETNYDNEGRMFYVSQSGATEGIELEKNGIAICRRGKDGNRSLAYIGDTHTGDQIKYITLASDGAILPKPLCSNLGGITGNTTADELEAKIFVLPQVFNNGPDSRVIHAVNAYATETPDTLNWQITLNVLTQENGIRKWTMVTPPPNPDGMAGSEQNTVGTDYLKVVVIATCSGKREAF